MSEHMKELLSDYMDDELNEMEKERIEKHLAICSDCNNRLQELMSLREDLVKAYRQIEIPAMIEEKVLEKIQLTSIRRYSGVLNMLAFLALFAFGVMLFVTTSPFFTVEMPIFQSVYSIARSLIYAIPSIISSIPYVVEVITLFMMGFIALAIITLRYLVHTMGKTVRAEDI